VAEEKQRNKSLSRNGVDPARASINFHEPMSGARVAACGRRSVSKLATPETQGSASQAQVAALEAKLQSMAAELAAAKESAAVQAAANRELHEQMTAAATAEQERVVAMGARLTEVMEGWQTAQQEWAATKAELEAEKDEALRKAAEATQLLAEAAAQPAEAARLLERLGLDAPAFAGVEGEGNDKAAPPAAATRTEKRSNSAKDSDIFPPKAPAKAGRTRRKQDGPSTGLPGTEPPLPVE